MTKYKGAFYSANKTTATKLNKIFDRLEEFDYDGDAIDTTISTVSGSNLSVTNKIVRSSTIIVAASDSSDANKEQADYVCTGTNDNIILQIALDALPNIGGELQLSEGTFILNATITRAIDNVTINGRGYSTYLRYNNLTRVISCGIQSHWMFKNFRVDYGGIDYTSGSKWVINNVWRHSLFSTSEYVDIWSEEHITTSASESFRPIVCNHPLVKILDNCQTEDWVLATGVSLSYDTEIFYHGKKSIKLVTNSDVGATAISATRTASYPDLTDCTFSIVMRTPDPTKIQTVYLDINTGAGNWTNFGYYGHSSIQTVIDEWFEMTWNNLSVVGAPDYTNVTKIRIRVKPFANQTATLYIGEIKFTKKVLAKNGIVTFSFDDGFNSCPDIAKPEMDKYGYKGVHSLVIGKVNDTSLLKAKMLQKSGWDVVSHSYNHDNTFTLTDPEWEYMLAQKWLADNGFNGANHALLYGGEHNTKLIRYLNQNMGFVRSSMTGYNSVPMVGNLLLAQIVQTSTSIATIKTWIDTAKANKLWLILMFHEVVEVNPVSYQITRANLAELIEYCNNSAIDVLPFSDVENIIKNKIIQNSGTGTIISGQTSVNIRHGFSSIPTNIQITLTSSLGTASNIWVSSKDVGGTGNLFTVSINTNAGADVTFDWKSIL